MSEIILAKHFVRTQEDRGHGTILRVNTSTYVYQQFSSFHFIPAFMKRRPIGKGPGTPN